MAIDLSAMMTEIIPLLNAAQSDGSDLVWWTLDDLYGYLNQHAQRLSVGRAIIAKHYDTDETADGTSVYSWPALHKGTVQVACGKVLRETTVREMEALDPDWTTATVDDYPTLTGPTMWVGNWLGLAAYRLYPTPSDVATVEVVQIETPEQITADNATVDYPSALGEYLLLAAVGEALRKESRGARPETSRVIDQMLQPIADIASQYWGM